MKKMLLTLSDGKKSNSLSNFTLIVCVCMCDVLGGGSNNLERGPGDGKEQRL